MIEKLKTLTSRTYLVSLVIITVMILIAKGFTLVTIEKFMERFNEYK